MWIIAKFAMPDTVCVGHNPVRIAGPNQTRSQYIGGLHTCVHTEGCAATMTKAAGAANTARLPDRPGSRPTRTAPRSAASGTASASTAAGRQSCARKRRARAGWFGTSCRPIASADTCGSASTDNGRTSRPVTGPTLPSRSSRRASVSPIFATTPKPPGARTWCAAAPVVRRLPRPLGRTVARGPYLIDVRIARLRFDEQTLPSVGVGHYGYDAFDRIGGNAMPVPVGLNIIQPGGY